MSSSPQILAFVSCLCLLQVGTGSHDYQQQHQQAHPLLSRLTPLNGKQKQDCSLRFRTPSFYLSNQLRRTVFLRSLDLYADSIFYTHFKWPKHPACDFPGHRERSHVYGYFNARDISYVWHKFFTPVHLFVFFLASLEIQSAYDNHRLLKHRKRQGLQPKVLRSKLFVEDVVLMSHSADLPIETNVNPFCFEL